MFGIEEVNLRRKNKRKFYYNKIKIRKLLKEIEEFLKGKDYLNDPDFTKRMMLLLEIKTNNAIEGFNDELDSIEEIILKKRYSSTEEKNRILNLYNGYRYILSNKRIDKVTLNTLYNILSVNLLDDFSKENMGKRYRKKDVFIWNSDEGIFPDFDAGIPAEEVEGYMRELFRYLKEPVKSKEEIFIKSQIMHFYFVYVHPYFDVNGRCARTFSLWYLLNNDAYAFTIMNRGISLHKEQYKKSIIKSRNGNLTPFLEFMLLTVKNELEKQDIIYNIKKNSKIPLSADDYEILEYILTSKDKTVDEVIIFYNRYNGYNSKEKVLLERIYPLVEKGIIEIDQNKKITIKKQILEKSKQKVIVN